MRYGHGGRHGGSNKKVVEVILTNDLSRTCLKNTFCFAIRFFARGQQRYRLTVFFRIGWPRLSSSPSTKSTQRSKKAKVCKLKIKAINNTSRTSRVSIDTSQDLCLLIKAMQPHESPFIHILSLQHCPHSIANWDQCAWNDRPRTWTTIVMTLSFCKHEIWWWQPKGIKIEHQVLIHCLLGWLHSCQNNNLETRI